jgi:hypothetical protein
MTEPNQSVIYKENSHYVYDRGDVLFKFWSWPQLLAFFSLSTIQQVITYAA